MGLYNVSSRRFPQALSPIFSSTSVLGRYLTLDLAVLRHRRKRTRRRLRRCLLCGINSQADHAHPRRIRRKSSQSQLFKLIEQTVGKNPYIFTFLLNPLRLLLSYHVFAEMSTIERKQPDYYYGKKPHESVAKSHGARTAETECQYMLPTLQHMVADKPDLKLLDIGCGPGSITVSLARYIPQGHVTGIDFSNSVLAKAEALAKEQNVGNVTFQTGDVFALPFEDGTFDITHSHQAVCHFIPHVAAIKELIRVTKKGGVLCMRETDLSAMHLFPPSPVLEEFWSITIEIFRRQVGTIAAGRQLKAWTVEAGIPRDNIEMTVGSWCKHSVEGKREYDAARILRGPAAEKAVEWGLTTR